MKVLLLSDHISKPSGVGKMSRNMIKYSSEKTDWIQLGGAWNKQGPPEIIDIDGVKNVKVYPSYDYGNEQMLSEIIKIENPDIILHFTDPRFWSWLYRMEFTIRKIMNIPIAYYSIWDNYPIPEFNAPFYNSCDMLIAINQIANNSHGKLSPKSMRRFVPHGVDTDKFYPLHTDETKAFKKEFTEIHNCDRVLLWNNINMKRKNPLQLMEAFAIYFRKHDQRCCLIMHTNPLDDAGSSLLTIKHQLFDDCNILFSTNKLSDEEMNVLYNLADGVISISSNEGFGLSISEAAAVGVKTIVLGTGGLLEQGRKYDSIIIEPDIKVLSGSQTVPYIYQDFANTDKIVGKLVMWKNLIKNQKNKTPHKALYTARKMSLFIEASLNDCISNFNNSEQYAITNI